MLSYSVITIISVYTFIYVYENCYNDVLKIFRAINLISTKRIFDDGDGDGDDGDDGDGDGDR